MEEAIVDVELYPLAHEIKRLRLERVWSKGELVHRAGIAPSTLWRIEKGEAISPDTIRKVADALGVDPTTISEVR